MARPKADTRTQAGASTSSSTAEPGSSRHAWSKFFDQVGSHGGGTPQSLGPSSKGRSRPSLPKADGQSHTSPPVQTNTPSPRRSRSARDLTGTAPRSSEGESRSHTTAHSGRQEGLAAENDWEEHAKLLRRLILEESGVPEEDFRLSHTRSSARSVVWKILLNCRTIDAALYLSLVAKGPSPMHDKIGNDAFRTLTSDQTFRRRVDEAALVRLLDAFVWRYWGQEGPLTVHKWNEGKPFQFSYVQGMNVLAAPFLYVMPSEVEAFHCFCLFIETCCPTYVQPTLSGVHRGLRLLERCLEVADPSLSSHMKALSLNAELYAFPSVMTFCACTPPLHQVLRLWDFLLAYGVHLSVPCIVAQLLLLRDDLMKDKQPAKLLRQFPDLDARSTINIAVTLIRDLDDALYDELVQHTLIL